MVETKELDASRPLDSLLCLAYVPPIRLFPPHPPVLYKTSASFFDSKQKTTWKKTTNHHVVCFCDARENERLYHRGGARFVVVQRQQQQVTTLFFRTSGFDDAREMEDLKAFVALIIFVPQLRKERRLDGPFSSAVRAARFIYFFSLFLSLSLFLFLSLSLSLVVALFLTDLTLSLSLSSRGLSPFDIFVSLRTRELTEEEAPKSKSLRARKPSRNRRTSNNRCRRWRTRKLSRPSSWVGAQVPVCTR